VFNLIQRTGPELFLAQGCVVALLQLFSSHYAKGGQLARCYRGEKHRWRAPHMEYTGVQSGRA
jgi:hypothetical protein